MEYWIIKNTIKYKITTNLAWKKQSFLRPIFHYSNLPLFHFNCMITLNHVQKQFGSRVLFKDCSLQIGVRDRVGLIGSNGSGKTTLFRMILGEESIDEGEILIAKGVKIGYLPQEVISFRGNTVLDEVLKSLTKKKFSAERLLIMPGLSKIF